jgi:hypothetical protein
MGISKITMNWILELEQNHGILSNSNSIADLGPQDLSLDLRAWEPDITAGLFDARDLYSKWGLKDYKAFDLFDSRAEIVDLSIDLGRSDTWDIVTNFGTSEHVFNQFAFMKNCHDLTMPGGISLHALPVASGMDHGFFNYHPTFFRSLAIANDYEILDFRYIPFATTQSRSRKKNYKYVELGQFYEFRERRNIFLMKLKVIALLLNFKTIFNPMRFYNTFFLHDLVLVAYRKKSNSQFVSPIQERYLKRF